MRLITAIPLLLLCSLAHCTPDLVTGRQSYNWFSVQDDIRFGGQVMMQQLQALDRAKKTYDSPRNERTLKGVRGIAARVIAVSDYPQFPFEVHLADLPIVNAWCAPGGKIMVYEGLWDAKEGLVNKQDVNELAAVLAHEIAHATARHVTESLSRNMTILLAGQAVSIIIAGQSAQGADLFQDIFYRGVNVFLPSYSRRNELEADRLGLMYMARAGYDPRAAVRLWERAAQRRGDFTSIYDSHPASGARAQQLKQYLPAALEAYRKATRHQGRRTA